MRRVEDINHFVQLTQTLKQDKTQIVTNSLLLPGEIERLTALGQMMYLPLPTGIAFLCDEGAFYRLYYYVDARKQISFEKLDKQVVIDFVYREGRKPDAVTNMQEEWQRCGFTPYSVNRKMSMSLVDYMQCKPRPLMRNGRQFQIIGAEPRHAAEIEALWRAVLDPFNSAIPEGSALLRQIEDGNVFCIIEDDTVYAADRIQVENRRGSAWQVAVDASMRRMGLGTALQLHNFFTAKKRGCHTFFLWVAEDNTAARMVYEKLGLACTKDISETYILK
jgi:GNAT superfamily N-acetyltransferase